MSDEAFAARAAAGDGAAFGRLVQQHQSMLRGFLLRLTRGDRALADDLAQESFLVAWRKIGQFRAEGSFAGWLARIAYSRYLMEARRKKLETVDEDAAAAQHYEALEPGTRFDLERCLAKLSLGERAAITLCYALGHSNEEAAGILDMPVGTVKSHVLRGRSKLMAMFGGRDMSGDHERLDGLLSAPLTPVPDNGFSARVMMKMGDRRQSLLETTLLAAAACVFLILLTVAGFPEWIEGVSTGVATSLPLAVAGFALALTFSYTRALSD
jgi:RNA polymerase sigma factor (sigma-70 family)